MEEFEGEQPIAFEQLQEAVNSPALQLPDARRDISKSENVRWLIRNIYFGSKGQENIKSFPQEYFEALKKLSH